MATRAWEWDWLDRDARTWRVSWGSDDPVECEPDWQGPLAESVVALTEDRCLIVAGVAMPEELAEEVREMMYEETSRLGVAP